MDYEQLHRMIQEEKLRLERETIKGPDREPDDSHYNYFPTLNPEHPIVKLLSDPVIPDTD